MLRAHNLTKSYGGQVLLDSVGFLMNKGERLALVGRNGSGKTTLFRMILGEEEPDTGELTTPKGYTIGHLSQHLSFHEATILDEVRAALPPADDGIDLTYKAEAALMGLGFDREDFGRPASEFSGGYQIRVNLAKVLVAEPDLLLLDEPTNYLDIVSVRWLEQYLSAWPGELIVISHDRAFLREVTTHTMLLHRQGVRRLEGSIEKVVEQVALEEEVHEKTRLNEERKRRQDERFIERFRAKASKARAVQSRIKALARRDEIEALEEERTLDFRFRSEPFHAPVTLKARDLTFGYPEGPRIVDGFSIDVAHGDRIAVIGKNGRGKTTLLDLLAREREPQRGDVTVHPSVRSAYFGQTNIDRLDHRQTIEGEILAVHPEHNRGKARSVCGLMMFEGDLALKKIGVLSGGERSRVLLGKILVSPSNLLMLDEPTNHLDLESVEALVDAIDEFPGAVIIVTHSEMILERMAKRLVVFDRGKVTLFEGGYRDFLERVGWEGEAAPAKPTPLSASKAAKSSPPKSSASSSGGTKPATQTPARTQPASTGPPVSPKERRRLRAAIIAERSKKTADLRKRRDRLQHKVDRLEEEIEELTRLETDLRQRGASARLAEASDQRHEKQHAIIEIAGELAAVQEQLDRADAKFESRLAELE
ncbi:MAG: ATP-binding cassette domain-containing protein [Planctomycetes bacterium]|nr:ATP-binding cassette domain-containing protein [Planctomycetota bacterium]